MEYVLKFSGKLNQLLAIYESKEDLSILASNLMLVTGITQANEGLDLKCNNLKS